MPLVLHACAGCNELVERRTLRVGRCPSCRPRREGAKPRFEQMTLDQALGELRQRQDQAA